MASLDHNELKHVFTAFLSPGAYQPAKVIMMVADALVPDMHQCISKHHAEWIVTRPLMFTMRFPILVTHLYIDQGLGLAIWVEWPLSLHTCLGNFRWALFYSPGTSDVYMFVLTALIWNFPPSPTTRLKNWRKDFTTGLLLTRPDVNTHTHIPIFDGDQHG